MVGVVMTVTARHQTNVLRFLQLEVEPDQCVFVGGIAEKDAGVFRAGIHALQYAMLGAPITIVPEAFARRAGEMIGKVQLRRLGQQRWRRCAGGNAFAPTGEFGFQAIDGWAIGWFRPLS